MSAPKPFLSHYAVLYTDDLEPITVLELSPYLRERLQDLDRIRLLVSSPPQTRAEHSYRRELREVVIWPEKFVRNGLVHLFLFTRDDEVALLLRSAFLPGQRRQLGDERAKAFAQGFLKAFMEFGQ